MKPAAPFEIRQGAMSGIGFRVPCRMRQALLPRELAHLRIGHVVVNVREPLGFRVGRPHTLWTSEVRDAGLGRNAGAGQSDDAGGIVNPAADALDIVAHFTTLY